MSEVETNGAVSTGKVDKEGTHATHCCDRHGCKYGDKKCPVELGTVLQVYPCIDCGEAGADGGFYDAELVWHPTIHDLIRKLAKQIGPKGKGKLTMAENHPVCSVHTHKVCLCR